MKRTQVTELFANIKNTFVSFFSILMFVALGVGIFVGINWTAPALERTADKVFDEGSFHNFQIQFPYGLTDDDIKQLSAIEGVTNVEPARLSYQTYAVGDDRLTVKVQSITSDIDTLTVTQGSLPEREGEIVLFAPAAEREGLSVGDVITFESDKSEDDENADLNVDMNVDGAASTDKAASEDADGMKYLNHAAFTVTGFVTSPEYLANDQETYGIAPTPSGVINLVAWVLPSEFDASAFRDGHPVVDVQSESLASLGTYTDEYKKESDAIEKRIAELGGSLAVARYDSLHDQIQKKIDDGEAKIAEANEQIAAGEKQLEEGRATLETMRAEGEAKLASGYQLLIQFENEKSQGETKLAEGRELVAGGEAALVVVDTAQAEVSSLIADYQARGAAARDKYKSSKKTEKDKAKYDEILDSLGAELMDKILPFANEAGVTIPIITHENYFDALGTAKTIVERYEDLPVTYDGETVTIGEIRAKLADAKQELADGEAQFSELTTRLDEGWAEYYAGQEELNARVAEAEQKLADGERQIADTKALITEYEPLLDQAKESLARMTKYNWTVMSRAKNPGVAEISTFAGVTNNLSFSMAALFVIVGLLVSYSAVSRIVHEQVTQIGTKKALGLRSGEITLSFILYSAIAVIVGAVIGAIVGFVLVEGIIGHVMGGMFTFGDYPGYFGWPLFLVVTSLELALVLGATWLACRSILREHAVELLKGDKPPEGKTRFFEKWAIWDKLPLLTQTIVNNCLNDKRRMFSTVVGVAGCTALIVTALTLNDDVLKSYDRHYSNVYGFDTIAFVDPEVDGSIKEADTKLVAGGAKTATALRTVLGFEEPNGDGGIIRMIVPTDDDSFSQVYQVHAVEGEAFDPTADGAWVTQAYAHHLGAKVGDTIALSASDGSVHDVTILGFYEFWLTYHEMVMGRDYYEREFDASLVPNVVLADTGGSLRGDLKSEVSKVEGFDTIIDDKAGQHINFETFSSVSSTVVLIYMALAILMAVVVLLNLNVMFIDEKKRELIVLMINGFSTKDAKRYIYNDTIALTTIGIILGLVLGCIMGSITVGAIEPSTATFVKDVDWIAVLVGIVGSALLAAIMTLIALRRIPRFKLTDINRL